MDTARKRRYADGMIIFLTGSAAYTVIEMLWRGSSHWTMTITGGLCALLIHSANLRMRRAPLWLRCLVGGLVVTAVELPVGCAVNLCLGWDVWDYSGQPLNLLGQICLPYSVCWMALSLPCVALSSWLTARRLTAPLIFG